MILLAMVRKRGKSVDLLLGIGRLPSSSCEGFIYSAKSTVPLINGGEIFYVVMMTLDGSRVITTLRAAVRNRGR